jgi:hypothetical protein
MAKPPPLSKREKRWGCGIALGLLLLILVSLALSAGSYFSH